MALKIESAGPGATIQDGGRNGLLRYGVTPAGPMDWVAFQTANVALGNQLNAAAIEIATGGLTLSVDAPTIVAFAGGAFVWTRDDDAVPPAARLLLRPGETLRARPGDWGAFAYLAVPGGIVLPEIMGSRSTHVRSALGGLDGRALRGGDLLPPACAVDLDNAEIAALWLRPSATRIRVILGPQDDHFNSEAISRFLDAEYTLTSLADRMAYKLEGPKLQHAKDFNIVSDGIALGAIQVAGDGQPMVLMADRQPTGGYPKIAHVCRADIGRLAQMRAGETCRFSRIDVAAARAALIDIEACILDGIPTIPLRLPPSMTSLQTCNLISGVTTGMEQI